MWISKIMTKKAKVQTNINAKVTKPGSTIDVQASNEHRNVPIVAPQGIAYVPEAGRDCVLLPMDEGVVALGLVSSEKNLSEGEIMLYSQNASISLKKDGSIHLIGKVFINGKEY